MLGRAGLGVAAVGDGKRGLQEFFDRRPDLVIIETSVSSPGATTWPGPPTR
ncbi:MAG: hypothetical protein ABWZ18_02815 [Solirubrobacterales bacterium]